MLEPKGLCAGVVITEIEWSLMNKPTNFSPLPIDLRELVNRDGAEEIIKLFFRFEATAKKLGFTSIAISSVKIQNEIRDAYGWPQPTE